MSTEPITQGHASQEQEAVPTDQVSPETDAPDRTAPEATVSEQDASESAATASDAIPSSDSVDDDDQESSALEEAGTSRRGSRHENLEHEGEIAADFLETLLDIADLDGDLEVNVEGDRAAVAIVDSEDGPAPKSLVGRGGVVLEALQELTRLAVQAETGDRSRLMLDVAGHRAGRRSQLVSLARTTTQQVKDSGERAALEPMSAFERKVVHDEVLAAGLVSESEGTEPNRYVVILPTS